jgi:hypothetical protein
MTSRGTHARIATNDIPRVFAVSQVRLDKSGHIADVWWAEVNPKTNAGVGESVIAPVADVVAALHAGHRVVACFSADNDRAPDRRFVLLEHSDGHETITLEPAEAARHDISNLA